MKVIQRLNAVLAGSAAVAVVALASAGLAQADGMPGKPAAYTAPFNWSGFYFGLHSGYAWSDTSAFFPDGNPQLTIVGVAGQGFGANHDAPMVGGQIGLQHQFGNVVLGVEGSLSSLFQNNSGSDLCPKQTIALFNCVARLDDLLTIGGRVGWAMGKYMPYVTAGYATEGWSAEGRNRSLAPGATTIIQWGNGRNPGWYIGGGLDFAVVGGWTMGVDYRHYDFGTNRELARAVVGGVWGPLPNDNADFTTTADTIALRVSWKFGRPEAAPLK